MKKALPLFALLILVLGLPAASYWFGLRAEEVLESQRQHLAEQYGLRIVPLEKRRGIFTSDYRYAVTYDAPRSVAPGAPAPASLSLDLAGVVHHGPFPLVAGGWKPALAVVDTTIAADPGRSQALSELLAALPDLRRSSVRTTVGFSGKTGTRLDIPPAKGTLRQADGTGLDLQWQGATGSLNLAADATAVDLSLSAPLLVLTDATGTLTAQGLSLASQATLHGQNLLLGDTTFALTGLRLESTVPATPSFALTNLEAAVTSGQQNEAVAVAVIGRATATDLRTQAKAGLDIAFSVQNLDAAALDATVGQLRRIQRERIAPEIQARQVQALLAAQAGAIFSRHPRFAMDRCALALPSGTVEATGFVAYAGDGPPPADTLAALGLFTASVRAKAAQAALVDLLAAAGNGNPALAGPEARRQAEAVIDGLVLQGFAVREAAGLTAAADWDGKALVVNGRTLFQRPR